ncbi:MAG: hypothetical protein KDC12_01550 [Flavobacteriales bacterium]|nr:hypothetical protein [Flavobacteriales bacterium]
MKLNAFLLFAAFLLLTVEGFSQTYTQSSGAVCSAYTTKQYTFENTPETPVSVNISVSWLYCGPWGSSNSGTLYMDIWVDGQWIDLITTFDSGHGCSWTTDTFTVSAQTWNNAINSNGGSVLVNGYISDSCPGGVGCSGYSDPCFNITATYDYAPSANFSASSTSICVDGEVTFSNTSTGPQETLLWDFGADASPATAEGAGPHNVSWSTEGMKDITLTVTGNGDEDTEVKTSYIEVGAGPASVMFGDAFESWQQSHYYNAIQSNLIVNNPLGGYYVLGTNVGANSAVYMWVESVSEEGDQQWINSQFMTATGSLTDAVCSEDGTIYFTGRNGTEAMIGSFTSTGLAQIYETIPETGSIGNALSLGSDGSIYLVGTGQNYTQAMGAKIDPNTGIHDYLLWLSGTGTITGTDALFLDGYFYMLSWGRTDGINPDMHLTKYEPTLGIEQWTFDFNGNGFAIDEAHEMVAYNGNIYIMGRSDQGADDGWTVVEVSPGGSQGWEADFLMGEADWDAVHRFDVDNDGILYLGSTVSSGANTAIKLLKINSDNGNLIWEHDFDGIQDTELSNIYCADNGQVFMSGRTLNNSGDWDIFTTEIGQGPNTEWWAVYDGCGSGDDYSTGLTATPNHEVIVAGYNTQAVAIRYGALVEPNASFEIASATTCAGNIVVFEDTSEGSALSYSWDFGSGATPATAEGPGPHEVVYDTPGVQTPTLYIENNLGNSETQLEITINPQPSLTASADQDICTGEEATLSATGGGSIAWDNGLGSGNTFTVSPTESTTYTATVTDGNGCTAEEEVMVNVYAYAVADAGDDITVCEGVEVVLDGSGEGDLSWDNDAGAGANPTITATETTTYTLTASNPAGCDASDSMTLTVNPAPDVAVDNDFAVCTGTSITLTAMGANTYIWYPSETAGAQYEDTPAMTTTYTVVGTGDNTCEGEASVTVTVNPIPEASAGLDVEICSGESTQLVAEGGTSYSWEGLGSGASQTVSPSETTTYVVTVTNEFECSDEDEVMVVVNPSPVANAGEDEVLCLGSSITLTGTGGGTYNWIGVGMGQTVTVSPTAATTYTLEVEAANGCTDQDQVLVNVVPLPNVNAGNDVAVCMGASTTLNATGGVTYEWSNGLGTGQSQTVSPLFETTYVVFATDQFGCVNSDTVVVTVNPVPSANAGADQTICIGETATLSASGGVEYEWNNGAGSGATVEVSPTETTTYTVTAISANQCEGTDDVTVNVYPAVELTISGLSGTPYCVEDDQSFTMTGEPSGGQFIGPGVNGATFNPADAGVGTHMIVYMYEDANGCDNETSTEVTVEVCDFVEDWDTWVELFPIPTAGRVTLKWEGSAPLTASNLTMFDASGRQIEFASEIYGESIVIDLSSHAVGTYTLVIQQGERAWTRGIVVER